MGVCLSLRMTAVFLLLLPFFSVHAEIGETDQGRGQVTLNPQDPECFEESSNMASSKNPESEIEKLFSSLSDEEVKTRLVFAETLAAGNECRGPEISTALSKGIAWVVENRVSDSNGRFGQGRSAIFKKFQFRSSFGDCDVAKRKAMLCPSSASEDWKRFWSGAQNAVKHAHKNTNNPMPKTYHYFFPLHFKDSKNCAKWNGVSPTWSSEKSQFHPDIVGLDSKSNCIEFYNL